MMCMGESLRHSSALLLRIARTSLRSLCPRTRRGCKERIGSSMRVQRCRELRPRGAMVCCLEASTARSTARRDAECWTRDWRRVVGWWRRKVVGHVRKHACLWTCRAKCVEGQRVCVQSFALVVVDTGGVCACRGRLECTWGGWLRARAGAGCPLASPASPLTLVLEPHLYLALAHMEISRKLHASALLRVRCFLVHRHEPLAREDVHRPAVTVTVGNSVSSGTRLGRRSIVNR
mmetsp:Transcript_11298/g.33506  ORF Transcript_11298/g.33506 Transcript_11298/m.33506 type:complete len:234 (+) Transcript_11298:628-1329(+)